MRNIAYQAKEELYDVIAALSAVIRELTNEIIELQAILLSSEVMK
jgi:DNA polymerase III delta prime subunit